MANKRSNRNIYFLLWPINLHKLFYISVVFCCQFCIDHCVQITTFFSIFFSLFFASANQRHLNGKGKKTFSKFNIICGCKYLISKRSNSRLAQWYKNPGNKKNQQKFFFVELFFIIDFFCLVQNTLKATRWHPTLLSCCYFAKKQRIRTQKTQHRGINLRI